MMCSFKGYCKQSLKSLKLIKKNLKMFRIQNFISFKNDENKYYL
jgi:hypothetical protein